MTSLATPRIINLSILGLLLCIASGCAVEQGQVYEKDGKQYGVIPGKIWRARWWNYYQRGTSYAEGKYWPEAIADFKEAIRQRDKDQRRARTYGLHFLDYFPHRELGVVYYHLKRYSEAASELELSLASVDTAKTKFYLNKVRKAQLIQSGHDSDSPRIYFDNLQDGLLTNRTTVEVAGSVEDDTFVAALAINRQSLFVELAEPRITFAQEIALKEGTNTIEVMAVDMLGKLTKRKITVHVDRRGPLVSIDRIDLKRINGQQQATVQGFVSDHSRIVRFQIAGRPVPLRPENEWDFQAEVVLENIAASIPFEIEDAAGNVTMGNIPVTTSTKETRALIEDTASSSPQTLLAFQPPENYASDRGPASARPLLTAQKGGRHPPLIKLSGLAERLTVYDDTYYLEGRVTDDTKITAFFVNGESFLRRPARQLFFGHVAVLKPGENLFVLEAIDNDGQEAKHEIRINYVISEINRLSSRLRVILFPFEKKGTPSPLSETVYDSLYHALVNQERFSLVEREQLERILQELKMSQTELVNPATAAKVGKIAAAEGMLIGSVTETTGAIEIYTRFVDLEESVVLAAVDVYGENLSLRELKTLMEGLAWKLEQRFPVVEGVILDKEGDVITINFTSAKGIKKHMKIILFREGKTLKHPRTGKILKLPATILGEARLETVSDELSLAQLLQPDLKEKVQTFDRVVTK